MNFIVSLLAISMGWALPLSALKFFDIDFGDRFIEMHVVLAGILGVITYQWARRALPKRLKLRLFKAYNWSNKSQLHVALFLFALCLLLSIFSLGIIVLAGSWDDWIKITLGLLIVAIAAHSFMCVMTIDEANDRS